MFFSDKFNLILLRNITILVRILHLLDAVVTRLEGTEKKGKCTVLSFLVSTVPSIFCCQCIVWVWTIDMCHTLGTLSGPSMTA